MANWDFKDLPIRISADKVLPYKTFNIAKTPKYDGIKDNFLHWFIIFW